MIVIADSGSTKCDWLVLNDDLEIAYHINTMGLNPYFHNENFIANELRSNAEFAEIVNGISEVHFYGAGCSNSHYNGIMQSGLKAVFLHAQINVNHDLMAAGLAVYNNKPVISCILGTGSNSCLFDGSTITFGPPSLGYIAGDEASGSYFGKILLNAYFYKKLPADLHAQFKETYQLDILEFSKRVYGGKNANVFLASFMPFISARKDQEYFKEILKKGFRLFLENHVQYFENYKEVETSFIGSIGFYFKEELTAVAKEMGIHIATVVQKPIFNLVEMYKSKARLKVKK